MKCADVPDVCNAEQSNDEPDDWDPDRKLKLKVGDVTVTVKQHTEGRQADNSSWIAWTRVPCAQSAGKMSDVPVGWTLNCARHESLSQVSDDCVGNLCGSRVTCRHKVTPTSVHLDDHTL